jgi:hypothetical protein
VGSTGYKRELKKCMYFCAAYSTLSIVAVVMEVFTLLAVQFCDGEDLMALYWSTWTVMQVGGLVAMFGIILATFNQICGRKNPYVNNPFSPRPRKKKKKPACFPFLIRIHVNIHHRPWALALGTPVLVVAGIGHAMHAGMKKRVKRVREHSRSRSGSLSRSISRPRTAVSDLPISRE